MEKRFLLLIMFLSSLGLQAQFVTLKGRQFYIGNKPFYPLILNYNLQYAFYPGSSNYILSHDINSGLTNIFECSDYTSCNAEILADLNKIKQMGFNMIRPVLTPHWDKNMHEFYIRGFELGQDANQKFLFFHQPFIDDPNVTKYFQYLNWLADQAYDRGMLTMINGTIGDHTDPLCEIANREFLTLLGTYFQDNTKIAFYDILSEPVNNYKFISSKQIACELTKSWYETLREVDKYHLISGGNTGFEETFFDVGLLKLDFSQPHVYSWPVPYDVDRLNNTINRIKGHLFWLSKNCPMPWIQGEVGFESSDIYSLTEGGTNLQQKSFVDALLAATRDYGGSGFVWWDYQDSFFPNPTDGYGLVPLGCDISLNPSCEKPAAQSFRGYLDPVTQQPPAPVPSNNVQPPNFYDPFLHNSFNPLHHNAVSGNIKDRNNQPIVGARVLAVNWLKTEIVNGVPDYKVSFIYTFTDNTGNFEVIPYNYVNPSDPRINCIKVSPVGSEYFDRGETYGSDAQMQTTFISVIVDKVDFEYNLHVPDQIITASNKLIKAWSSIDVSNTTVQSYASVDLRARDEISLLPGFNTQPGSHLTIYPAVTFQDCEDFLSFFPLKSSINTTENYLDRLSTEKQIELQFIAVSNGSLKVFIIPNPSDGKFTVEIQNNSSRVPIIIKIKNMLGMPLAEFKTPLTHLSLDMSNYSKGIYLIEVGNENSFVTEKCILQ